jgi:hypothetical protein
LNRVGRLNVNANFGNLGSERAGAGFANFNLGSGVLGTGGLGCEVAARSSGREKTGPTIGIFNASMGASGRERASAGVTKFKTTSVASLRDRAGDAVVHSNAMSGAFGRERAGAGILNFNAMTGSLEKERIGATVVNVGGLGLNFSRGRTAPQVVDTAGVEGNNTRESAVASSVNLAVTAGDLGRGNRSTMNATAAGLNFNVSRGDNGPVVVGFGRDGRVPASLIHVGTALNLGWGGRAFVMPELAGTGDDFGTHAREDALFGRQVDRVGRLPVSVVGQGPNVAVPIFSTVGVHVDVAQVEPAHVDDGLIIFISMVEVGITWIM